MKKLSCPSCGAEVVFQSAASVSHTCLYCQSLIVRHDLDLEVIGKSAILQQDASVLQIGTGGKFAGNSFQLVGRIVQKWTDGSWSEWYAFFDDGNVGWIAEAQGFYMVSFERKVDGLPERKSLNLGKSVMLGDRKLKVDDIKEAECAATFGELPFVAKLGRRCTSVDLSGPENVFGCLDFSPEGTRYFEGKYQEFDDFSFTFLKEIDGW